MCSPPDGLPAALIRITTTGRARPSFSPLSTLSRRRSRAGTSRRPTIAEAKTGSVGARTAPTSIAVIQSNPATKWARTATPPKASGIPMPRARAGWRHDPSPFSVRSAVPSTNRTVNSARSARLAHDRAVRVELDQPEAALADQGPGQQEHQRGRQHRPRGDPGDEDRDEQADGEQQDQRHRPHPALLDALPRERSLREGSRSIVDGPDASTRGLVTAGGRRRRRRRARRGRPPSPRRR